MARAQTTTTKREQEIERLAVQKGWRLLREGEWLILADAATGSSRWRFQSLDEVADWLRVA